MSSRRYVTVPVTTLWTSPTAPRDVDALAVAPQPDVVGWLTAMDAAEARLGLHGRVHTQLELGEPVDIIGDPDRAAVRAGATSARPTSSEESDAEGSDAQGSEAEGWLEVVAPLQPSSLDGRGYPGWVLAAHVSMEVPADSPLLARAGSSPAGSSPAGSQAGSSRVGSDSLYGGAEAFSAQEFIGLARTHLGLPYLWGGMSDWGLDCSGLVLLSLRRLGVVIPRDADDQYDACEQVPPAEARPGDLFFFAHTGKRPHHVGIVTGPGRMLHAPETGATIVEEDLTPSRQATLIGAGRLSSLASRGGPTG